MLTRQTNCNTQTEQVREVDDDTLSTDSDREEKKSKYEDHSQNDIFATQMSKYEGGQAEDLNSVLREVQGL